MGRKKSKAIRRTNRDPVDDLFREVSHLSAITGAQIAAVTITPSGETRAYGCPSVDYVVDRFLRSSGNPLPSPAASCSFDLVVDKLKRKYIEAKRREEAAKGTSEEVTAEGTELKELQWELEFLEKYREKMMRRRDEITSTRGGEASSSSS